MGYNRLGDDILAEWYGARLVNAPGRRVAMAAQPSATACG